MLDEKERRHNDDLRETSLQRFQAADNNFVFDFEARAARREEALTRSLEKARKTVDLARAAGKVDYEMFVKSKEDHFKEALADAELQAKGFGKQSLISADINGDGVIDEDEVFDDPQKMAKAFLKARGISTKKPTGPARITSFAPSYSHSRVIPETRSLLDTQTCQDYEVQHIEDALSEALRICCPDTPGNWDLGRYLVNGETPELSGRVPKHVLAQTLSRVQRASAQLRAIQPSQPHVHCHCQMLEEFALRMEGTLTEQLERGFSVSSYFDQRPAKVFREPSSCDPLQSASPVFVRL